MHPVEIVLGIVITVLAVLLITFVLLQSGKDKRLSGTIAGAAETFFAKGKSKARDAIFSKITTILSFVFVILAVVLYIMVVRLY
ncbi:MAG: preprotein translocase subunit SecG [Clostridia bacterium]|nr:preprotein translocase subunit SecG [Clostridia bacterium]